MLALNISVPCVEAEVVDYDIVSATKPPIEASDLLNVPVIRSTSSVRPQCAAVPSPFGPRTPSECASSTRRRHRYFLANGTSSGRSTMSPSMLYTPSTTTSLPRSGSVASSRFSR